MTAGKPLGRSDLAFAWVNAAVFLFAAAWGSLGGLGDNPLGGLRRLGADPWVAWPLAAFALGVALLLSVPRWRSRERLLFTAGALACAWLVMCLYVAPGPAIGLAVLSGLLYRHARAQ